MALHARVWQRYGQLRVYVSDGVGTVGWCDPRSGRHDLARPDLAEEFWAAVQAECDRLLHDDRLDTAVLPPGTVPPPAPGLAVTSEPDGREQTATEPGEDEPAPATHWAVRDPRWDDLALTSPGEAARNRARELRREHPVLVGAASLLGLKTLAGRFAAGAKGERVVGRKLNRWAERHGWHVLHAVPVGHAGADIDHVVVAACGVVTVNTKTTRTRVWVGEYGMTIGATKVDYLRKSRVEGRRAQRLISRATGMDVPVQPVIVFVGARRFTVRRGGPKDVAVLPTPRALHRWLRRQPPVLTPAQVEDIYRAARLATTWQRRQPGS